jgi:hypothetical protein
MVRAAGSSVGPRRCDLPGEKETASPSSIHGQVLQVRAVQKLHNNERLPFVFPNFMDGADIGMVEGRGGACFTAEAFERLRILSDVLGQKLQCDKSAKLSVLGFIDHAHATTQFLDDAVVRDGLAEHLQECYGVRIGMSMHALHCSFAYSALASFRMGMSGSASFQRAKKSW